MLAPCKPYSLVGYILTSPHPFLLIIIIINIIIPALQFTSCASVPRVLCVLRFIIHFSGNRLEGIQTTNTSELVAKYYAGKCHGQRTGTWGQCTARRR